MGKADLHIHTTHSYDGTASVSATLEHAATRSGMDVIAITDHDEIDGALEAIELAPRYRLHVIPGIEISTAEGHLLALFVRRLIPRGLSLIRTLELVGEEGGVAIAPHPGGIWEGCLSAEAIRKALGSRALAQLLVGGEEFNGSLPWLSVNRKAAHIVHASGLAPVAGSDAHMLWMIGRACTEFAGSTADDLRAALLARQTWPIVHARPWYFIASYLHRQSLRAVGLAQWSAPEPGAPISLRRLAQMPRFAWRETAAA